MRSIDRRTMSISCAASPRPTFPLNHSFVEKLKIATLVDKNQVGKVALLLKTPLDRNFFPPDSKMGMLDEMKNNQRMIDQIVKKESKNVNIECFIIIIKNVKIKNLKCLVWCMIVCSILNEIWQSIPASEYQGKFMEKAALIESIAKYHQTQFLTIEKSDIEKIMKDITAQMENIEIMLLMRKTRKEIDREIQKLASNQNDVQDKMEIFQSNMEQFEKMQQNKLRIQEIVQDFEEIKEKRASYIAFLTKMEVALESFDYYFCNKLPQLGIGFKSI